MVGHCVEFVSGEEVEMKVEGETPLVKLLVLKLRLRMRRSSTKAAYRVPFYTPKVSM